MSLSVIDKISSPCGRAVEKWEVNEVKGGSGSQELFSDDDQLRDTFYSPKLPAKNDTFNSSVVIRTPILYSKVAEITPGKAVVPKTPTDLLPFITKTSVLWTSDMETPPTKLNAKTYLHYDESSISVNNCSPYYEDMKANETKSTSPVLGGKKRPKKRVRKRLVNIDLDNNSENQTTNSSNSDQISSKIVSSPSNEILFDVDSEIKKTYIKYKKLSSKEEKENKKLVESVVADKNSNTSTQDFFSNASFSSIDRLCCSSVHEEPSSPILNNRNKLEKINQENISKEDVTANREQSSDINISKDILEKVAAIKRIQKPLRRSTDISHTVIPKEVFSKSLIELELADAQVSQEKRRSIEIQNKPLKPMPLTKFSAINNKLINVNEKINLRENNIYCSVEDVPNDIINEWIDNKASAYEFQKENLKIDFNSSDDYEKKINIVNKEIKHETISNDCTAEENIDSKLILLNRIANQIKSNICTSNINVSNKISKMDEIFYERVVESSTASHKNIAVNKDKLPDSIKVCIKTENEDLIQNSNHTLKKNIIQNKPECYFKETDTLDQSSDINTLTKNNLTPSNFKIKKSYLSQELGIEKSSKSKFISESLEFCSNGFNTARGKGISVNSEKENFYFKIYNELDDVNIEKQIIDIKKSKINDKKLSSNNTLKNKPLIIFNKKETNFNKNILTNTIKPKLDKDIEMDDYKNIKENIKKENYSIKSGTDLNDFSIKKEVSNIQSKNDWECNGNKTEILPEIKTLKHHTSISEDGFSTASGKNIKVNEDKERHYTKIFNKLSEDILDQNDFHKLSKTINSKKLNNKTSPASHKIKNENERVGTKLSISSDTDEAFYNLGDIENLFVSNPNNLVKNQKMNDNDGFTIPYSMCISKVKKEVASDRLNKKTEIFINNKQFEQTEPKIKQETDKVNIKKDLEENEQNQDKKFMGLIKRKIENYDVKRPERCRSFGGFPENNEIISGTKLNKSDPLNDSLGNQPLQTGLSISQCFDTHSDSMFFDVDVASYLYNNHVKPAGFTPPIKKIKIEKDLTEFEKNVNHLGFSFKECTESFRLYSRFKQFFEKLNLTYNHMELSIKSGQSISIFNQTASKQSLHLKCDPTLDIQKNINEINYILIESETKKITCKILKNNNFDNKVQKKIDEHKVVKRKFVDQDSDTPLSTLKKPRIGFDLLGRKLFSDESSDKEKYKLDSETQEDIDTNNLSVPISKSIAATTQLEEDLSENRLVATLNQEKIIRNKKRLKIKPLVGSLLCQRIINRNSRISWIDLVGSAMPTFRSLEQIQDNHPDARILEISSSNATCYKFLCSNIIGNKKAVSIDTEDGGLLIFDENGHLGVSEFVEAFLAAPGVDPKLIPNGWIENHYKWIIWKLACMDRISFNSTELPKILTPERVMKELKYRYDREIDRAQRPALRKILEKDDVPSRRMVLCISSIIENTNNNELQKEARIMLGIPRWRVEATDGWYSIPLTVDNAMAHLISTSKIKEGTKLITCGAELLNCERGFFPLEVPPNVSLKIYSNCTRRVRWDTKLGYQKSSRPIPIKLRNILVNGGMIGETTAVAARVYPLLYREKTQDGQSIYRNARCEEKAAITYERSLELKLDAMYAEAQKNYDLKEQTDFNEDFQASQLQRRTRKQSQWERKREEFKQQLECEVRQNLPPPRQVTPVVKIRLVDDNTTVILTIWGANEDSAFHIKEGDTITIYNSFAMGTRDGVLNITANRATHIKTEPLLKLPYPCRTCIAISDIKSGIFQPKFDEFDTVGLVVSLGAAPYGMKNFDMVVIAWPKPQNSRSYLSILFWHGVASFGYQGMFPIGSFIACSNLQWRKSISWSIAVAYSTEKTVFTSNPRQPHLAKELRNIKALVENPISYAEICAEEVSNELTKKPRSAQGTPTSLSDKTSFHNVSIVSPMENYSPSNSMVQKRMEKLSRYRTGALDISPAVINNSSVLVTRSFTPVTRKKS